MTKADRGQGNLWKRLVIEGPVIVISILLAFAIEAWWDEQQQAQVTFEQLARVAAELEANALRIEQKQKTLDQSMAATIEIMSWMGPEPDDVSWETYTEQITPMLSIGFLALQRSATNDILATGQMSSPEMTEIRQTLSGWSERVDQLERQYALLRVEHGKLIDHLQKIVPGSHIVSDDPALGGYTRSRFPFSHQTTLSNPRLEGLLSVYLIRQSFVLGDFKGFMESQSEVLALIEATTQD